MTMPNTSPVAGVLTSDDDRTTPTGGGSVATSARGWWPMIALWGLTFTGWFALVLFPEDLASLANENGLIEWVGTVAFGAATAMFWIAARRDPRRPQTITSAVLGLVFFVAFMEELSWGQQVFRWNTPAAFDSNTQQETNFHNLPIGIDQQQLFTLGILCLAVFVPLLFLWAPARRWIARLGIPVVSLGVSAWVVATLLFGNVAERATDVVAHRGLREYMEMLWGVAALLVAISAWRHADRTSDAATPQSDRVEPVA
jgi:hypothetical protein